VEYCPFIGLMRAYRLGRGGVGKAVEGYECWHSCFLDGRRDIKNWLEGICLRKWAFQRKTREGNLELVESRHSSVPFKTITLHH
jgi:hypothetical protein